MEQSKLERINELARKSREQSLSPEELLEQKTLREEYIAAYRASLRSTLENTYIQRPDGTKEKLKSKKDK